MKAITASIIVMLLAMAFAYHAMQQCNERIAHHQMTIERKQDSIVMLQNELETRTRQVEAGRRHMSRCAFISKDQVVKVEGAQGHWIQLDLAMPGYPSLELTEMLTGR